MKQSSVVIKLMSVLLAFCLLVTGFSSSSLIYADATENSDSYESMSSAEKQAYLEQKIKELDSKLASLGEQSEETEEYIDTLNEKISYLQQELSLAKTTIENSQKKITSLENQYEQNEAEIKNLQVEIEALSADVEALEEEFNQSYEEYAQRARALYISGDMNTLTLLLTSKDISTMFTRLEMIKRVSKLDKEILENIQNEGEELLNAKEELENKETTLTADQEELVATKENLEETIKVLEEQQASYNEMQASYEAQKEEADALLLQLHQETETYSEYRNEDLEELEEINAEIEQAALEWEKRQEAATTTTTTTTTKKQTTGSGSTTTTKKQTTTTTKKTTTASSSTLQLTYPVPTQTTITCGWQEYSGHTGVDFACSSGSRVVAAEDGEVIISTDLKNSDGSYRSYGRYIVIAHYKKDSSGNYVYTLYAHNSSRVVSVGDTVTKGQLIAYSGSTGNSTGPHCHFEVRTPTASYSSCVNPTPYLP